MTVQCPHCLGYPGRAPHAGACMRCGGSGWVEWQAPVKAKAIDIKPLQPTPEELEQRRREAQAEREYWDRYERYA